MTPRRAIGIDLGGTNIKGGIVDRDGRILHREEMQTGAERGPDPVIDDLAELVRRLGSAAPSPFKGEGRGEGQSGAGVVGVGLATPGPLDLRNGRIIHAANLPGWKDVPIRDALAKKTGLRVTLENDANAAAFGELSSGAGRGCQHMALLTLGTGVGAGVIVDGRLLHGHFDNAAELGHMILVVNGSPCPCGQRGCLERYASADAVVRRVRDEGPREPQVEIVSAADVARRAAEGDATCRRVWDEACLYLAVACVNIQHAYNSQRIILGGGLSLAGDFLLEPVRRHLHEQTWRLHDDVPEVLLAGLGSDAGLVGAGTLALANRE